MMLVANVKFRDDLYPRIKTNAEVVQRYIDALEHLPPIEVNQHYELIDGWHRWTAYREAKVEEVEVIVTETKSDAEFLELAIRRNSKHGMQLSGRDKEAMAQRIYSATPRSERPGKKKELQSLLAVNERTIRDWLERSDAAQREQDKQLTIEMWAACYTEEEIAATIGVEQKTISNWILELRKNGKSAEFSTHPYPVEFKVPLYNVWKKRDKSEGISHPGNTDPAIIDNLIYLYTDPLGIVVDPFAGGGSTIDVCKKRGRRYWVSDLSPKKSRAAEIRQLDLTHEMPALTGRWEDVHLVYLDPPYWWQAKGKYGDAPENLANMDLGEFNTTLYEIITMFLKLAPNAAVALIIQPTQWNAPEKMFVDHLATMIKAVDAPIVQRIQAPLESQQYNAQQVKWAEENKKILVLSREIIVWGVA